MIELPKIEDPRGNLSFIEHGPKGVCPFEIERVGWIYDVVAGGTLSPREGCRSSEMIVAMSGSLDVVTDNKAAQTRRIHLNRSDRGVVAGPGEPLVLDNFSTNAVAMILGGGPEEKNRPKRLTADPHPASDVADVRVIELPRERVGHGSRTVVENGAAWLPFDVRRVFYLYDVPADSERGGHSHYEACELMVALTGSFDVVLDDGKHEPRRFTLNRPYRGLYIPTGLWRTLDSFSGGAVCLVLTSERYSEADYVRDYEQFRTLTKRQQDEKI